MVTGGAGFIGSNFIRYWLKNHPQDEIINYDKLTYAGNLENLKDIEGSPNYKLVRGDIVNHDIVRTVAKNVDAIVHFAAESHVDRSIMDSSEFVRTNVLGTQVLLQAAKDFDLKFYHISTDEVFGSLDLNSRKKFNEKTPYDPKSPYAASKAGSDHLVRSYIHTHGLDAIISNCANNFGPYMFPEKFIPLTITNLFEDKKVPVYGDGLYVRDWLYVEDHCRAIELIMEKGKFGETYCIGGMTKEISNIEVVKKILKILDKSEDMIEFVKDRPGHDRKYAVDWKKARKELGYKPQADFEERLGQTVKWYQDNQDWWQHVKSGEYKDYYSRQYS